MSRVTGEAQRRSAEAVLGGRDVLVEMEEVGGVVAALDLGEAVIAGAEVLTDLNLVVR